MNQGVRFEMGNKNNSSAIVFTPLHSAVGLFSTSTKPLEVLTGKMLKINRQKSIILVFKNSPKHLSVTPLSARTNGGSVIFPHSDDHLQTSQVMATSKPSHSPSLTFRHRASSIEDRNFATLQRTLFIYLINKYILLSDICLTVHH